MSMVFGEYLLGALAMAGLFILFGMRAPAEKSGGCGSCAGECGSCAVDGSCSVDGGERA